MRNGCKSPIQLSKRGGQWNGCTAFTRGMKKEEAERTAVEQGDRPLGDEEQEFQIVKINEKKNEYKREDESEEEERQAETNPGTDEDGTVLPVVQEPPPIQPLNPSILSNSILTSVLTIQKAH